MRPATSMAVISGGPDASTVSVAFELSALPAGLLTSARYRPASKPSTFVTASELKVAPEMSASLKRHWYVKGAVPDAMTVKLTLWPAVIVRGAGLTTMTGGLGTNTNLMASAITTLVV